MWQSERFGSDKYYVAATEGCVSVDPLLISFVVLVMTWTTAMLVRFVLSSFVVHFDILV